MLFAGTGIQDSWQEPEYCVQKGQPVFRKNSPHADPFTAMSANPEMARNFDQAMAIFAPMTAAAVADAYDLSRLGTVADIGAARFKLARIVPTLARVAVIEGVRAPIEETKSGHPGDVHLAGSRSALKKLYRAIHEERH